ncbi:MAG: hypothetical protein AAFP69_17145, partial [Planctomycetota bacterium]
MIWYGLIPVAQQSPDDLVPVAKVCRSPKTLSLIARGLAEHIDEHPSAINGLIQHIAEPTTKDAWRISVMRGIAEGLKGRTRATAPADWKAMATLKNQEIRGLVDELSVVFGDGRAAENLVRIVKTKTSSSDPETRQRALQSLIQSDYPGLRQLCLGLLKDQHINVLAARGLAKFDDVEVGQTLSQRYNNFRAPQRPKLMAVLTSRPSFAIPMLAEMKRSRIPRHALSAYDVRQLNAMNDPELKRMTEEVWGRIRDTPQDQRAEIARVRELMSKKRLIAADKSNGRALFVKSCQNCHRLYGRGEKIGPELTGADRKNLEYLLTNIISPSAVVSKDYRMTQLLLDDGRQIGGLVTSENDRVLRIQTATDQLAIDKSTIEIRRPTELSPMPSGLLSQMADQQIADLIAYLQHPTQVPMPGR